jgi:acyl-coenzyme A thioesterase PaaI-like protein
MDGVLARAVHGATGGQAAVTVHLSLDYLAAGRAGEWLFGEGRVTRQTRDLVFVEGRIFIGERDLVRATAIFKPMRRKID